MDMETLMAAMSVTRGMADSSAGRAERAAEQAEAYGYRFTVEGHSVIVGEEEEGDGE